jgi:hypothetical protein
VLLKNLRDKSVFEKATQELEFIKSNEISLFSGRRLSGTVETVY